MIYIKPEILERVNTWLTPTFDQDTQDQIKNMIASDPKGLEESFYKDHISLHTENNPLMVQLPHLQFRVEVNLR